MANSTAIHTWGGHAMKDDKTGKWVGFYSYMAYGCDLHTWTSNSMIVSAIADEPDGPYNQDTKAVTGPWTHNAMISRHPNGSYLLFHIGDGTHRKNPSSCSPNHPFYPFPKDQPEPPAATTHISESLHGPWRATHGIPHINNPAPFYFPNGTTLIYGRTDVHVANSTDGPYVRYGTTVPVEGKMKPEDPHVWRDARGFHMLFNANSGHSNCRSGVPCGGHAWSNDGLSWSKPKILSFGTIVHYEDNSTVTYGYMERPQVALDKDGKTPLTFFTGHGYSDIHNLAVMFCQDGDKDSDCVTTVQ